MKTPLMYGAAAVFIGFVGLALIITMLEPSEG